MSTYYKNKDNRIMNKKFLSFVLAAVCVLMLGILTGCSDDSKVVYEMEVVTPIEEVKEDEPKSGEEAVVEEKEEASEEVSKETEEESEEFLLLDPDESSTDSDDDGNVVTEDGKIVVDLVFFMGQSNMSGAGGDATKAPVVEEGHGYEFRTISDPTRLYTIEEPFGKNESFIGGICDLPGAKKGSMVASFANEYYKLTGVPIVGVSASQGASTTEIWQTPGFQADMKERYARAVVWLESSGYYIRNRYAIWFQGESDAANHVDPDVYNTNMDNIIRPMFISGLNKVFIITPGRTLSIKNYFADIVEEQLDMCRTSGYYALGTNILSDTSAEYMVDEWHYNQDVLNLIGIETARSVACYTLYRRERVDYDYFHDQVFISEIFDYWGNEHVDPINLSNIPELLNNEEYRNGFTYPEYIMVNEPDEEAAE